jgi:hypothetical protein
MSIGKGNKKVSLEEYNLKQKLKRYLFAIGLLIVYYFKTFSDNSNNTPTAMFGFDNRLFDQIFSGILMLPVSIFLLALVMNMAFPDMNKKEFLNKQNEL